VVYLKSRFSAFFFLVAATLCLSLPTAAQQTLGGITGTVVDPSGSAIPGVEVTATSDETKLVRTAKSNAEGTYALVNLPIGTYTLTFTLTSFSTERIPGIVVQADRTVTLPAKLAVGATSDSVTVSENPLLNATDTTNGYVLDKAQIEAIPLPTGSFTGVAILSPGVNAELPGGTGSNSGLGNAPIWANGQRDTLQWQIHQPGRIRSRHQQHRISRRRRGRSHRIGRFCLSHHRQRDPNTCSRNHL
jgi:hypothetical protein